MPPKPGNAFAQQKEIERQIGQGPQLHGHGAANEPARLTSTVMVRSGNYTPADISAFVGDMPDTPTTTMSMFTEEENVHEPQQIIHEERKPSLSKKAARKWKQKEKDAMRSNLVTQDPLPARSSALPDALFSDRPRPLSIFRATFGKGKKVGSKPDTIPTSQRQTSFGTSNPFQAQHLEKAVAQVEYRRLVEPTFPQIEPPFRPAMQMQPSQTRSDTATTCQDLIPLTMRIPQSRMPDHHQAGAVHPGWTPHVPVGDPRSIMPFSQRLPLDGRNSAITQLTQHTSQSNYLPANLNRGILLSNTSLSPTRQGTYATTGIAEVVRGRANITSMRAAIVGVPPALPPPDPAHILALYNLDAGDDTKSEGDLSAADADEITINTNLEYLVQRCGLRRAFSSEDLPFAAVPSVTKSSAAIVSPGPDWVSRAYMAEQLTALGADWEKKARRLEDEVAALRQQVDVLQGAGLEKGRGKEDEEEGVALWRRPRGRRGLVGEIGRGWYAEEMGE